MRIFYALMLAGLVGSVLLIGGQAADATATKNFAATGRVIETQQHGDDVTVIVIVRNATYEVEMTEVTVVIQGRQRVSPHECDVGDTVAIQGHIERDRPHVVKADKVKDYTKTKQPASDYRFAETKEKNRDVRLAAHERYPTYDQPTQRYNTNRYPVSQHPDQYQRGYGIEKREPLKGYKYGYFDNVDCNSGYAKYHHRKGKAYDVYFSEHTKYRVGKEATGCHDIRPHEDVRLKVKKHTQEQYYEARTVTVVIRTVTGRCTDVQYGSNDMPTVVIVQIGDNHWRVEVTEGDAYRPAYQHDQYRDRLEVGDKVKVSGRKTGDYDLQAHAVKDYTKKYSRQKYKSTVQQADDSGRFIIERRTKKTTITVTVVMTEETAVYYKKQPIQWHGIDPGQRVKVVGMYDTHEQKMYAEQVYVTKDYQTEQHSTTAQR